MLINIVLSGDNAVVVGMAAAGVGHEIRRKVILWGMVGAVVLRIVFAVAATRLLSVVGLALAGGILLLWVCWKMYRQMPHGPRPLSAGAAATAAVHADTTALGFWGALGQIIAADVSMSLDNVLAVAGAAGGHTWVLVV